MSATFSSFLYMLPSWSILGIEPRCRSMALLRGHLSRGRVARASEWWLEVTSELSCEWHKGILVLIFRRGMCVGRLPLVQVIGTWWGRGRDVGRRLLKDGVVVGAVLMAGVGAKGFWCCVVSNWGVWALW